MILDPAPTADLAEAMRALMRQAPTPAVRYLLLHGAWTSLVSSGWAVSGLFASGVPGVVYLIVDLAERVVAVGVSACHVVKIASSRSRSGIGSIQGRAGTTAVRVLRLRC